MAKLHPRNPRRIERERLREMKNRNNDDQDSFESTGDYSDSDIDQDAQRQYSRNSRKKHRHRVSDIRESSKENRRFDPNSYDMGRNTKNSNKAGGGSGVKKPKGNPKDDGNYASDDGNDTNQQPKETTEVLALKAKIAQLETAKSQAITSGKRKAQFTNEEKRWQGDVRQAVKKFVFGSVKFIGTDKKLIKVAGKLALKWNLRQFRGLTGKDLDDAVAEWVMVNKHLVRDGYLACHNYAQAQLRAFIVDELLGKGKPAPTPEDILKCALRDKSLMTSKNQWIFDMYCDQILFKVMGKEYWSERYRHHHIISGAMLQDQEGKACISPGTEAYCVALYKNCYQKWVYMAECKVKDTEYDRKNPRAKGCPFIQADNGQAKWGGWNQAGREYFTSTEVEVKKARQVGHVTQMEEDCLKRLRIKYGIIHSDGTLVEKKTKKKRKHVEEVAEDMDDVDDI